MGEEPTVVEKKPCVLELEANKRYWWCRCGRSKEQPFCDGSHGGTGIEPICFEVEETKRYALCLCKYNGGGPFCDGSHKKL